MSNKSEATWHPNSGPEVPHADLRERITNAIEPHVDIWREGQAIDALLALFLAALGDTVPRAEYRQANTDWRNGMLHVEAEREALAHVIEQVRETQAAIHAAWLNSHAEWLSLLVPEQTKRLDTAPAVSLALHDAEVKAQALDEAAQLMADEAGYEMRNGNNKRVVQRLHYLERALRQKAKTRAAAIREEAK